MSKNFLHIVKGLLACSIIFSCSSDRNPADNTSSKKEEPAVNLMKESKYDPSKIDDKAPVVDIELKARGKSMADMSYSDTLLQVAEGCTIHLTLTNESTDPTMQHNFVLIDDGTAEKVAMAGLTAGLYVSYIPSLPAIYVHTKILKPGEKTEIRFPAPERGTYEFICTFPGHYQRMRGKMIVG